MAAQKHAWSVGSNSARWSNGILWALLLVTIACVLVPFYPSMPAGGIGTSFNLAMNKAVAQRLAFGKDVIFTFGPYASVLTGEYHPATNHLMLVGAGFLGISYWFAVFILSRNNIWYLILALSAAF